MYEAQNVFNRLLREAHRSGVFLLRDDPSKSRRILSFRARTGVFHVYVDNKDNGVEIGLGYLFRQVKTSSYEDTKIFGVLSLNETK